LFDELAAQARTGAAAPPASPPADAAAPAPEGPSPQDGPHA